MVLLLLYYVNNSAWTTLIQNRDPAMSFMDLVKWPGFLSIRLQWITRNKMMPIVNYDQPGDFPSTAILFVATLTVSGISIYCTQGLANRRRDRPGYGPLENTHAPVRSKGRNPRWQPKCTRRNGYLYLDDVTHWPSSRRKQLVNWPWQSLRLT